MARKTKEEAQETCNALLDAAEQVFCVKGVTNTTLNEVAKEAGMTRGAIYWHFKDKNALFKAMCDRAFLPIETLLNEITSTPPEDPFAALRQLYVHMLKEVASSPRQTNVFNIIFHRCEKGTEMSSYAHEKEPRNECILKMEDIFKVAVTQKKLPVNTDTWIAVQMIHSYSIGLIYEWLVDTKAYDLAKRAEYMIDVMLAGIIAKPPLKN